MWMLRDIPEPIKTFYGSRPLEIVELPACLPDEFCMDEDDCPGWDE